MTNVIHNEYMLEYSAAVALTYITKYYSKTFHKFKIYYFAYINFLVWGITIMVYDGT